MGTNGNPVSTTSGMSNDTKLIVAAIVATGIGVAVLGTVLGSQILHNGTEIRTLRKRITDEQHLYVEGLKPLDAATTHLLNERMRDIENELEKMNGNLQNRDGADAATTRPLSEQVTAIQNALEEVHRYLRTVTFPRRAAMRLLDERMRDIQDKLREVNRNLETQ